MEVEKENLEENPDIFLDQEDLDREKNEEENLDITNNYIEINDIENKVNSFLLIGTYGNGSALLKLSFYLEMKNQKNSFKTKFYFQDKSQRNKKVFFAELYQLEINGTQNLILLTKSGLVGKNYKFLLKYLEDNKISFQTIISFDAIWSHNFFFESQKMDVTFVIKNDKFNNKLDNCPILKMPNTVTGFSAFVLKYADFMDIPCAVFVSVVSQKDIGIESVNVYENCLDNFNVFSKDKLKKEYFEKNNVDYSDLKLIFNEFNAAKKSYFI